MPSGIEKSVLSARADVFHLQKGKVRVTNKNGQIVARTHSLSNASGFIWVGRTRGACSNKSELELPAGFLKDMDCGVGKFFHSP